MKRDSTSSSISKIYLFMGIVGLAGIFLLLLIPRPGHILTDRQNKEEEISQALLGSRETILSVWKRPYQYFDYKKCNLPTNVGISYYECNPEAWKCLWDNIKKVPFEVAGNSYHITSSGEIEFIKRHHQGIQSVTGHKTNIEIVELGVKQSIFLSNSCHEIYLPQRLYPYASTTELRDQGFIWDNHGRHIFVDKFYVSQGDIKEWKQYLGERFETSTPWAPAKLLMNDQDKFCSFHGKKKMMAHIFDASQMTPADLARPFPDILVRTAAPWQRDLQRTYFWKARKDNDYRPTQLDCSLAQVKGCSESFYMSDSVSWMGVNYGLGFEEETFDNPIDSELELKKSSNKLDASSEWHALGVRSTADNETPYSFRCFREVL